MNIIISNGSNDPIYTQIEQQIKAAIILPFMLDSISNDRFKMVEFYEGFLLALDSLKKGGVSVDLYLYDSGSPQQSIAPILEKPEMKEMNIIFGPMYSKKDDAVKVLHSIISMKLQHLPTLQESEWSSPLNAM